MLSLKILVEHLGIEPSVPEAADLQSAESPLILLLHKLLLYHTTNSLSSNIFGTVVPKQQIKNPPKRVCNNICF